MSSADTTASSAYGKEVFMSTIQEASKKVNFQTIKERGRESLQLLKEKLLAIEWHEAKAQLKDFNLEIIQPYRQVGLVLPIRNARHILSISLTTESRSLFRPRRLVTRSTCSPRSRSKAPR
jgi:hypothetical protein